MAKYFMAQYFIRNNTTWLFALLLCVAGSSTQVLRAQNYFSHHHLTPYVYNSAYIARLSAPEVNLLARAQWVGYEATFAPTGVAPNDLHLVALYPNVAKSIGVGLGITRNAAGPFQVINVQAMVNYSFFVRSDMELSFGLTPSFLRTQRDVSLYRATTDDDPGITNDQAINYFSLQASTAFFYNDLSVGLSVNDLLSLGNTSALPSALQVTPPLQVNVLASYDISIPLGKKTSNINPSARRRLGGNRNRRLRGPQRITLDPPVENLVITPMLFAIYRTGVTFNVGGQASYKRVWGGLLYRFAEALTFFGGVKVLPSRSLRIGYSIDLVLHNTAAKTLTSHEIYLSYGLDNLFGSPRPPTRTPRFYF